MHPVLFKIGPLTLYSYGALLAAAFVLGVLLARRRAPAMGVEPQLISDLALYILLGILVGARLLHVISAWGSYRAVPLDALKVWEGGLAFHGGLIGALMASLIYLRCRRVSPWRVGDVLAPSIALGHAIGRLGCLLNGCCFGKVTGSSCGISFPPGSLASQEHFSRGLIPSAACSSLPVLPTQIFSALALLGIFALLLLLTRRATFPGEVFWGYILLYGGARFVLELFRGDNPALAAGMSLYQWISLFLAALALGMLLILSRRSASGPIYPGTRLKTED